MADDFELPETFDPSAHEGTRDLECIPINWYQMQLVENEIRPARNGNGTYLLAVFEVLDGEYRGRKVYQNITLQNDSQQAVEIGQRLLTDIYTAIGHTTPTRDTRVLLFKPVMARVGIKRDKDGVFPDRNCITSVRSEGFQPKRGRGGSAAPVAPRGAVSPPTAAAATAPSGDAPWRS
jgi:Protein of unknown function (DUF669)